MQKSTPRISTSTELHLQRRSKVAMVASTTYQGLIFGATRIEDFTLRRRSQVSQKAPTHVTLRSTYGSPVSLQNIPRHCTSAINPALDSLEVSVLSTSTKNQCKMMCCWQLPRLQFRSESHARRLRVKLGSTTAGADDTRDLHERWEA